MKDLVSAQAIGLSFKRERPKLWLFDLGTVAYEIARKMNEFLTLTKN